MECNNQFSHRFESDKAGQPSLSPPPLPPLQPRGRRDRRDIGRIWRVAEALEYGIVGINEGIISTRDRSLRGHEGKRHRPRRLQNTASRNSSKSNISAWAASTANGSIKRGERWEFRRISHRPLRLLLAARAVNRVLHAAILTTGGDNCSNSSNAACKAGRRVVKSWCLSRRVPVPVLRDLG
jgi:hypothetical protein